MLGIDSNEVALKKYLYNIIRFHDVYLWFYWDNLSSPVMCSGTRIANPNYLSGKPKIQYSYLHSNAMKKMF
jgi:hypothetical protein